MKNKTALIILTGLLILSLTTLTVQAGQNNNNGDNGKSAERGTGKENLQDGCNVPVNAKDVWVYIPPSGPIWLGGACCASNIEHPVLEDVYFPNQCCNPPDFLEGPGVPGNHCLCFENRGLTEPVI